MLPNSIVVASGKGGVGTSSFVANVAGVAASSGWRVLVVDLDPEATLGHDLGYAARPDNDQGRSVHDAVLHGTPVVPVLGVRPGLDAVPAGSATQDLARALTEMARADALGAVDRVLAEVARPYDLVLLDTAPIGSNPLTEIAFASARFLVAPTPGDRGSMIGLLRTLDLLRDITASDNPGLRLLGMVLFGIDQSDGGRVVEARHQLIDALGAPAPIFDTCVRRSPRTARDCRAFGLLAHEHETAAGDGQGWLTQGEISVRGVEALADGDAPGLADDYYHLAREVLSDYRVQVEAQPVAGRARSRV